MRHCTAAHHPTAVYGYSNLIPCTSGESMQSKPAVDSRDEVRHLHDKAQEEGTFRSIALSVISLALDSTRNHHDIDYPQGVAERDLGTGGRPSLLVHAV